jgi:hypothetical protein
MPPNEMAYIQSEGISVINEPVNAKRRQSVTISEID